MIGKNIYSSQGNESLALQNTGVINGDINVGLTLTEITELFERMFSEKYPVLVKEAIKESHDTIAGFACTFYSKLDPLFKGKIDEELERKFASSDFQTLLFKTVEQVGSKAKNAPKVILSNLLLKKLCNDTDDYYINQVIDILKYLNRNQVLFLVFSSLPNIIFNMNELNKLYYKSEVTQKETLYVDKFKESVNNILFNIDKLNPTKVDIGLLSSTVLIGGGYRITNRDVLQNFGKGLNKEKYTSDMLYSDFPLYLSILEKFGGRKDNIEIFIQPLNRIGEAIVENIDISNFNFFM